MYKYIYKCIYYKVRNFFMFLKIFFYVLLYTSFNMLQLNCEDELFPQDTMMNEEVDFEDEDRAEEIKKLLTEDNKSMEDEDDEDDNEEDED
jgi:hypothetical protein